MPLKIETLRGLHDVTVNEYELECFPADRSCLPLGKKPRFALICPGGGYSCVMSVIEGAPYARALNQRGYAAFVLRYRCRELARGGAPVEDIARAVREILDQADGLGIDPDGWSLWGSSAGGHAAGCFATEELGWKRFGLPAPAALVLAYPVVTMGDPTHVGTRDNLLGKTATAAEIARWSVEAQVTDAFPPTFVWNSEADETVPPVNSLLLAKALAAHGVPYEYLRFSSGRHGCGLDLGGPCESWFDRAVAFWESQG